MSADPGRRLARSQLTTARPAAAGPARPPGAPPPSHVLAKQTGANRRA